MAFDVGAGAVATEVAAFPPSPSPSNGNGVNGNGAPAPAAGDADGGSAWHHASETEPDWDRLIQDKVRELLADDAEWIRQLNAGTITSAAKRTAIQQWADDPAARKAAHTKAATSAMATRRRRWQTVAQWTLTPAHQQMVLKRGFSEEQVRWMFRTGLIRSLSWDQVQADWLDVFPKAKETKTGGMLLCFDPKNPKPETRTYSLRCDVAPVEKRITGDRPAKYLYAAGMRDPLSGEFSDEKGNPKNLQQPFIPNGMKGPDGKPFGEAEIATEGLFDALVCTILLGVPCVGLTAPGHLRGSVLPKSVRLYLGDADQWLAPGLLPTIVGQCCSKGINLSRLPLRAGHDYTVKPRDLHPDAKAGMEELTADLGAEQARETVLALAATSSTPGDYLDWEIEQLKALGLKWPEHEDAISSLISAVADAHRSSQVGRDALLERIHAAFGVGKRVIAGGVKKRLARIEEKRAEEKRLARQIERESALARGDVAAPEMEMEHPSNKELQDWVAFQHDLRLNELTSLVEIDGTPITSPKMAYQLLAQMHGIECRKEQAIDALEYVAMQNPYNPVREYLLQVKTDKSLKPVTSRELAQLMGIAPGDDLSIELLWRSLAGTALRGLTPGAKFDQCPILSGLQGLGKSAAIEGLAGSDWYDVLGDQKDLSLDSWGVAAKMNRCWMLELGEVGRLTRGKHADELKVWLSSTNSRYAEKNEKRATDHPKRAVPWGTTNDDQLLNDPTGTRRYWIIRIAHEADYTGIPAQRDRIWRTVLLWMEQGLTTWLNRNDAQQRESLAAAAARGAIATFEDPWLATLLDYTEALIKAHRMRGTGHVGYGGMGYVTPTTITHKGKELLFVRAKDLLDALQIDKGRQDKGMAMRASAVMRHEAITQRGWQVHRTNTRRGFIWAPDTGSAVTTPAPLPVDVEAQVTGVTGGEGHQMPWYDWDLLPTAAVDGGG